MASLWRGGTMMPCGPTTQPQSPTSVATRDAAGHRLAQDVGEAFAPGGTQRGDIEAGDQRRHVGALAEQGYVSADPALAHQGA